MEPIKPMTVFVPVDQDYPYSTHGYISNAGTEMCKVQEQKLYVFTKADLSMLLTDNWCKAIDHLQDIVQKNDFSKNRKEYINNLLQ